MRDILGVKQKQIVTQQAVSKLEQKDVIDDETLVKVAKVLKVPVEVLKNFDDDATISFVANTFNDFIAVATSSYHECTFQSNR